MSNNMVYERVHDNMNVLGLSTAEEMLDNWLETAGDKTTMEIIDRLFADEVASRRASAIEARTRVAGFPVKKELADFDFKFQKSIDRTMIDEFRTMRFIHNTENVILLGPPGVGKTHIAIGLGLEAIRAGFSAYFINCSTMMEQLKAAARKDNLERKLKTLKKYKLLIIDEIGYLPFDAEASNLFFRLISMRYENTSTIFTANKSYSEWGEIFGDPVIATAILDRILHHSTTMNIKGDSYRLKMRKKTGTLFKTIQQEEKENYK